jgi:hypothetical protein
MSIKASWSQLKDCLIRSHVAIVTVAVLVLWAFDSTFKALWPLVSRAGELLFTAIAILGIPYFAFTVLDRSMLLISANYLYVGVVTLAAASIVSHWVYGVGPFRSLAVHREKLQGWRDHV